MHVCAHSLSKLELIDSISKLGLDRYFVEEINEALNHVIASRGSTALFHKRIVILPLYALGFLRITVIMLHKIHEKLPMRVHSNFECVTTM
mgnify:FL=1